MNRIDTALSSRLANRVAVSLLLLLMVVVTLVGCRTEQPDPGDRAWAENSATQGLGEKNMKGNPVNLWYDSSQDKVRPITLVPPEKPKRIRSSWDPGAFWAPILKVLAWVALATILGVIIYFLLRGYIARLRAVESKSLLGEQAEEKRRIEALPLEARRKDLPMLKMAEQFYREGKYAEAVIYLFSHQLLQMDHAGLIRLARGKTNRQYLNELQRHGRVPAVVAMHRINEQTMLLFEDSYFGGNEPTREAFEACWSQLARFEQAIREVNS